MANIELRQGYYFEGQHIINQSKYDIDFLQLSPCTHKACNLYKYVLELSLNMLAIHWYIIYIFKKEYNFLQGGKV